MLIELVVIEEYGLARVSSAEPSVVLVHLAREAVLAIGDIAQREAVVVREQMLHAHVPGRDRPSHELLVQGIRGEPGVDRVQTPDGEIRTGTIGNPCASVPMAVYVFGAVSV